MLDCWIIEEIQKKERSEQEERPRLELPLYYEELERKDSNKEIEDQSQIVTIQL